MTSPATAAGVNDAITRHEASAMMGNPCPEPVPAPTADIVARAW